MLSSSPEVGALRRITRRRLSTLTAGAVAVALSTPLLAAQVYFRPSAEISTDVNSNRDLIVDGDKEVIQGYTAFVGGTLTIDTPRTVTTVRPQVGYSDYPKSDQNAFQGLLDFNSFYTAPRTHAGIFGRVDRRDTYNSELASAEFNPVNPDLPTTPETGRVTTDGTRTLVTLVPEYSYALTQRLGAGLSGIAQSVDYSGAEFDSASFVPYMYYQAKANLSWALNEKSGVSLGVYGSKTENKEDDGSSTGNGVSLNYDHRWTPLFRSALEINVERDEVRTVTPFATQETSTNVGATYTTTWKGEVSQVDLSAGRSFTPGGSGGTFISDQLQVQYSRNLSQRTVLNAAVRYISYQALSESSAESDYDFLNASVGLRWRLTPKWYIGGTVDYWRQKFESAGGSASNVAGSISFGYQGLERPR